MIFAIFTLSLKFLYRIARGEIYKQKNTQESPAERCIQYTNGFMAVKEKGMVGCDPKGGVNYNQMITSLYALEGS